MWKFTVALALLWACLPPTLFAAENGRDGGAHNPLCQKSPGFIGGPFVPTEAVAKRIFQAVQTVIGDPKRFPEIVVSDQGEFWSVAEAAHNPPPLDPARPVWGGGQLYLQIDKCTGAISNAAYNR